MSKILNVICTRCGQERTVDQSLHRKEEARGDDLHNLCLDCRKIERSRVKENNVPLEAILEAVRTMKEQHA
jgi:hypothetical protein